MSSLWGDDFDSSKKKDLILDKVKNPKSIKKPKAKVSIEDTLISIRRAVEKTLGHYADSTVVIKSVEEYEKYISDCISAGVVALDTETNNSLDPYTCKLMGLCLYAPGLPAAYVPVNHRNRFTDERLDWQLNEEQIADGIRRLSETKIITHNGKFDYQVVKCTCNVSFPIYWDSQVAAKVLDENERSAKLKDQYVMKIDSNEEKYSIEHLFQGLEYAIVEPETFALYAATDSFKTYKLYEYQLNEFLKPSNRDIYQLYMEVEVPIVTVVAEMELTGVCLDLEYSKRLGMKYDKKLEEINVKIEEELKKLKPQIDAWRLTPEASYHEPKKDGSGFKKSKSEQLTEPINILSPTQLAILFYDVLKHPIVDKKSPRGTGEEILAKMNFPICKLILELRGISKLKGTYVDKLPQCLSERDGRLHASFNQYGAATGRFSSSDPNLQNIPSHENSIRMMFTASPGYVMIGSDFSQQEPRLLAHYSGDENMIQAYKDGKDLYAMIASKVYQNNYEDNLEFNPITKQIQPDGKKRRSSVKSLLLGIMYSMAAPAIAEKLSCSIKEAEGIRRSFFDEFPKVESWIDETNSFAREHGYVSDVWGRRRRLPDLMLDKYIVTNSSKSSTFNPLLGSSGVNRTLDKELINKYLERLNSCRSRKEADEIKEQAKMHHLSITDNSGFIARAERQCVNARIQGGAATMSKRAMIKVFNNEQLKQLGFRLLIAVHDELIGECPEENKERCKELLSEMMIESAKPEVQVPMKCDADDFKSWYLDVYSSEIKKEYNGYMENNSEDESFKLLMENHIEATKDLLHEIIYT